MKNTFLEDLSESNFDKVVVSEELKAGWGISISSDHSWYFTFTWGSLSDVSSDPADGRSIDNGSGRNPIASSVI